MKAHMELLCPACGWSKSCGPLDMVEQMRTVRMLRAGAAVEPAFLFELFGAAAGKSTCPDCQHQGLSAIPEDDGPSQWPSAQVCHLLQRDFARARGGDAGSPVLRQLSGRHRKREKPRRARLLSPLRQRA